MKNIYLKRLTNGIRFPIYFILIFFITAQSYAQSQLSYEEGSIRIKFDAQQSQNLDMMRQVKSADGYVMTGINAIDQLNRQYKVNSMKRVFREAGKFEAKHRKHGLHLWYEITLDKSVNLKQSLVAYTNTKEVAIAEHIYKKTLSIDNRQLQAVSSKRGALPNAPNDPQFINQWHYNNTGQGGGTPGADISLLDAWKVETGNSNIIVAITDGGVQVNHPDLAASMWVNTDEIPGNNIDDDNNGYIDDINGYGFGDNTGAIAPDDHGSHVGGTIAAVTNNGIGVSGVAGGTGTGNGVRLMSCAAFGDIGTGGFEDTYVYGADNGAVISQNSWGYTNPGVFEQVVLDGIDYFIAEAGFNANGSPQGPMQGGIVIFAAGNSGTDAQWYPGIYSKVMAVAGSDRKDNPYGSSNRGSWVELTAPAVGVLSSISNNGYAAFTGTSMACPHVSGTAALIVSKYAGNITPQQVWDRLVSTTDKVSTLPAGFGSGRLNASSALQVNDHKGPEKITDLKVISKIQNALTLRWTAPIDSGNISASAYDIRYSKNPIDSLNFLLATKAANIPTPLAGGEVQTFTVTGLQSGTLYYFAIKSADLFGNTSKLSNIAADSTTLGSEIEVSPDSLEVTIDVKANPEVTKSLIIHNSGKGQLEYSSKVLLVSSDITSGNALKAAPLDMKLYGLNSNSKEKIGQANIKANLLSKSTTAAGLNFIDSIFYDKDEVADDFVGFTSNAAFAAATKFTVTKSSFVLTHVRNLYRTQPLTSAPVIIEVYKGGTSPSGGTLLLTKTVTPLSTEGEFFTFALDEPKTFIQGEVFWVVFKYPNGISFPQGIDEGVQGIAGIYFYSPDGGSTWNPAEVDIPGAAFKTRAMSLSTTGAAWVTLDPTSGIVPSDSSQIVAVKFNAADQYNGTYAFNVLISSNDISDPVVSIPVLAIVKGQDPNISASTKLIEFGSVLVGAKKDLTFELSNTGKGSLNISSITSTIPEFTIVNSNLQIIKPGEKALVTVRFAPKAIGNKTGKINVNTNDPDQPLVSVIVVGVGTEPPVLTIMPDTVYTTVNAGEITSDSLTIKNTGAYPLVFSFPEFAAERLLKNPNIEKNNTTPIAFSISSGKNVPDTRKGHPVKLGAGEDKEFGYTWIDSNEPGGPVFNWQDIATTGTRITPGADGSVTLNLPFKFKFFGDLHPKVIIASNGFLTFSSALGSFGGYLNTQIPAVSAPSNLIAPFWDDLEPQEPGASVSYKAEATRLIVQYTDVPAYNADGTVTFQVILYKDGNIEYLYKDVESASFLTSSTVGIENREGTDGAQVAFNSAYIKDSLAVRFTYPLPKFITDVSILSGILLPGEETTVVATLDATELNDGKFLDHLVISSNDPANASKSAPFVLTVIGVPQIEVSPETLEYDTVFVGTKKALSVLIQNTGTKTLEVSDILIDNAVFSVALDSTVFIDPKDDLTVPVTFTPTSAGPQAGILTIISKNAQGGNDSSVVTLSGVGVTYPQIEVTPTSITKTVRPGGKVMDTLTIKNNGGYRLDYTLSGTYWINPAVAQAAPLKYAELTSKDQLDTRKGVPVQYGFGGPDSLGYVWIDNKVEKTVKYEWKEISTSGTKLVLGGDNALRVKLPFKFKFYGKSKDSVYVASNGFLTFNSALGSIGGYSNSNIPSAVAPNELIAPFWDDIEPQLGDGVYYLSTPESFIVQFTNIPHYGTTLPGRVTFQVILYPDGSIKYLYKNVAAASFKNSATVGIENPKGTDGLRIVFNAAYLQDSLAVFIKSPLSGSVKPGEQVKVAITLDAKDLKEGVYKHNILVRSNDPVKPQVLVPVTLIVGMPNIVVADSLVFGSVFVSPDSVFSETKSLLIKNTGTVALNISSIYSEDPAFSVSSTGPISIDPGKDLTIWVKFSPMQVKDYSSFIVILSDAKNDTVKVAVSGKGIATPKPIYYTLSAKVKAGSKALRQINIDNSKGGSSLFYSTSVQYGQSGFAEQRSYPLIEKLLNGVINIPASTFESSSKGDIIKATVGETERTSAGGWLTVVPPSGEVKAGKQKTLEVTLNSAGFESGHYYAKLLLNTNDPFKPAVEIPAHLQVNAKPVFVSADTSFTINRTDSLSFSVMANDADKDSLVYSLLGNTPNASLVTVGGSAVFSFIPTRAQVGMHKFSILASDDIEADTLTIYVNVIDSNNAPQVVAPISDKTYAPGAATEVITLSNVFTDADRDVLAYSVTGSNSDVVEVTIIRGRLFIIPLNIGQAQVTVTATDESGASATDVFMVTVSSPSDSSVAGGSKDNGEITTYPNPAIEYTNLKYELTNSDFVSIEVLNGKGEQVAVLVNEHQAEGKHQVKFETKGLSLGLYFYRVRIGDHVITKRIIIQ